MKNISRILIANRGEIAVRIIKACKALGIESVIAVSEADKESLPAKMADRFVCIGPPHPGESYLKIETLITAALGTGSDAIHPGYGFLAEQPKFAEACKKSGIVFIGPDAEIINQMGNKLFARELAKVSGIPIIPGSEKVNNFTEAISVASELGYPVLLKSAAGGGGRGMRVVTNSNDLKTAFEMTSSEARAAFGDETIFIEKFIPNARHIEVQILADKFGNVLHLGERDCSLQRRYQKVIEEAPASTVPKKIREEICQSGVTIAKKIGYNSVGTVEFFLDQDAQQFYFLEMNTRIQVEHPVTEMISGIDIVQEQIKAADNSPLEITQSDVRLTGCAIECRINAESPDAGFRSSPGRIDQWNPPEGPGIRVDSHCYSGYFVPPYYDSLLAKIITVGKDRAESISLMQNALANFEVSGIDTTIPVLQSLIAENDYQNGKVNTRWVEKVLEIE